MFLWQIVDFNLSFILLMIDDFQTNVKIIEKMLCEPIDSYIIKLNLVVTVLFV